MTKARDIADFKFENITDTGTEGTKVASGTTAQRGSTTGQIRFNSTTGLAEYYNGTAFKSIDSPPTVSSIDVTEVDSQAGGNQTIVITGSGFASGATVSFVGNSGTDFNASTVTVDSETQITAVAPKSSFLNAQEPYGVKVTNVSGLSATLADQINVDSSPSWQTASGSLGNINEDATGNHVTVSATDPDGDTVSYSETGGTVLSGAGLTLNSSTGVISGDPNDVSADTTLNFTLRATANSKTADRAFSVIIKDTTVTGGDLIATYSYGGTSYKIHKFTSTGNLVLPTAKTVDYLIIGGGGGGGSHSGGGGGSGGLVWLTGQSLSAGTFQAVIGDGGIGQNNSIGTAGSNSSFNSHIALGGGYGASGGGGGGATGGSGGSGGGGGRGSAGGSSTQNSTYGYGQGFSGASSGANNGPNNYAGYAGGGTGQDGQTRVGGEGDTDFINSSSAETTAFLLGALAGTDSSNVATTSSSSGTLYIGGGGGGSDQASASASDLLGGKGGGGNGSYQNSATGNTVQNTGSGGGGSSIYASTGNQGGTGAKGIVIVRYAA